MLNPYVQSSTIHNTQDTETTYMPTDRWTDKEDMWHVCSGTLLSHEKDWNHPICSNMHDLEIIRVHEESQKDSYDITCMWNLKYDPNELINKQKQTHRQRTESWLPRGRGDAGETDCEFATGKCLLLYEKWSNSKVLLCSTGNYIQYPVIKNNGK